MVKEAEEGTFLASRGTFIGQNVCIGGHFDFLCCGAAKAGVLGFSCSLAQVVGN
jgi:hypothetical protein